MRFLIIFLSFLACQNPQEPSPLTTSSHPAPKDTTEQTAQSTAHHPPASFSKEYLMGKFNPATHPDFAQVPAAYTDGDGVYYLHKMTIEAFSKMHEAAKADGIHLQVVSATRNFDRQKEIWEAKWTGARKVDGQDLSRTTPDPVARALKILTYSSMPGTSRHHWGTDLDINSVNPAYFETGKGLKEYEWLVAHATQFGFCQVYTPKGEARPFGYEEEYWHWSWMPLSKKLTAQAKATLTNADISGFKGAETAAQIDVVGKYILGVNPECLP